MPIDDPKDITMQDLIESELTGDPVRARHLQGFIDSIEERVDGQGNLVFFDGPRFVDDYSRISPIMIDEPSRASVMAAIALMRRESELGRLPVIVIDDHSVRAREALDELVTKRMLELPPLPLSLVHMDETLRSLTVHKNREAPDDWGTVPLREDKNGFHIPHDVRAPFDDAEDEHDWDDETGRYAWAGIGERAIGLILSAGLRVSIASIIQ